MIGLALSGGGSRAIAFHLGCLRALEAARLLPRVKVLSTISGGSVIGAYYAYTPGKSFEEFESDVIELLRHGFEKSIGWELLKPANALRCLASSTVTHFSELLCLLAGREPDRPRAFSRTDLLRRVLDRDVYRGCRLSAPRRHGMSIVIGATDLRYGSAFRFSENKSGDWRRGELVSNDLDVAFAVAASAAYPIFLPAIDRTWKFSKHGTQSEHRVCLTDGGVYDNLGLQALDPGRDPAYSIHDYPCEYIIACNAGHGQDTGTQIPIGFYRRVSRSFTIIHRRVQDAAMARLHSLKQSNAIKGFAMPYLGQIDDRVKWGSNDYIKRDQVICYPTNFRAMTQEWIDRISARGEELTHALIPEYLSELL